MLGVPEDGILDSAWFFDTNFHLNAAGAVVYTARLAENLKKELGIPGSVSIALPTPPSGLNERSEAVLGPDADLFLYEERDGEAYLTALKPEGKSRTHLQVPGEMDGLPVTAFSPALFSGNAVVEEIVLPLSVRRVENGSFAGCTALKDLVLLQPSPSRCSVGEGLLEGTGALVRVPASSYSLYQTGYFWSLHAARIRPAGETEELPSPPPAEEQPLSQVMIADANGGLNVDGTGTIVSFPVSASHLRTNTPLGQNLFRREGHVPLCWNTSPDGTGEDIPFGSRTDSADGKTLYMKWLPQTPETELLWEEKNGEAWVTGRTGSGSVLALPDMLGGLPVRRIVKDAFRGSQIITAVLPPTLFAVEQGAFSGSGLQELWLYDSLYYVYEESFASCRDLKTLHIGAATSPRYSVSYFGAFADKLDWLRLHSEVPKIVLAGGSATRYAYDSEKLQAAFPSFTPVNMGVYAYTNMLPQYRLMECFMGPGDILISAPEFDTVRTQFCESDALDERFWNMAEADWACVSLLDLREYSQVFSSLSDFLHARRMMTAHRYEETPRRYDDDGSAVPAPTYNRYGDYTLPRPNGDRDELLQTYRADYTAASFPPETVTALRQVYNEFQARGVEVLFAYAPRNHSALTEESTYDARQALDAYLRELLPVKFLLSIEDSLYPGWQCYLIDNHLSDEGVRLHMDRILRALTDLYGS